MGHGNLSLCLFGHVKTRSYSLKYELTHPRLQSLVTARFVCIAALENPPFIRAKPLGSFELLLATLTSLLSRLGHPSHRSLVLVVIPATHRCPAELSPVQQSHFGTTAPSNMAFGSFRTVVSHPPSGTPCLRMSRLTLSKKVNMQIWSNSQIETAKQVHAL